jgi:methionyl-tRNA formyltransferase
MRVVFAGTPEFAAQALTAILAAGHVVPLVLTQPDRPAGRGMSLQPGAVKQLALAHGLALHQPTSLKTNDARSPILEAAPEVMVVAAYGLILPQAVLDVPVHGCLNIHASLLPRWRGAAPIQRALLAGDRETGITIMQMDAGLDTGPVLLARQLPISPGETAASLHDRLAALGANLIVEALARLQRGELSPVAQAADGATYAAKIDKSEARIDWRTPARELERAVRAFDPYPVATCQLDGVPLKIWRAAAVSAGGQPPGTVLATSADGIVVACGEGSLRITELQKAGGRRLSAAEFLRGTPVAPGTNMASVRD